MNSVLIAKVQCQGSIDLHLYTYLCTSSGRRQADDTVVVVVVACDHCNTASAKGPRTDDEMQSLIYIRGAIDCSSLRSQNGRSVGMDEQTDLK